MWKHVAGAGLVSALALSIALFSGATHHAQQPNPVDFARDVQPILAQRCYECHGPEKQKNGFRLDRRRDAMRGGTIAVIGPGNSHGSRLYQRLIGDRFGRQMPPDGDLPAQQVAIIKAWIDQGAKWPDALAGDTPAPRPNPAATNLMAALRAGDRARFRSLLAATPDAIHKKGPGGATPLMQAVLYGDAEDVRLLLERGADPNARDEAGATALMWAVNDLEKTRLLVERGADVKARSTLGRSPLMIASLLRGATPVVQLLLDRGADPSEKGPGLLGEVTPLFLAAYSGDESTFSLLAQRGADTAAAGFPTFGMALRARCMGCAQTMMKHADAETFSMTMVAGAPPRGPALATPMLLERGADVHARDREGRTILMLTAASEEMPLDIVKLLIAKGADVNAKSPAGETALGLAKLRGDTAVTQALRAAGAEDVVLPPAPATTAPAPSVRVALARSLPLVQEADAAFMSKSGCVSCHHNSLASMTVATARRSGWAVNEKIARKQTAAVGRYLESWRDRALQGIGIPGDADTVSYLLLGLAAEKHPADAATDAMARFIKEQQRADGRWDLLAHRPPIGHGEIATAALSLRALQLYAPAADRAVYQNAVARAGAWIAKAAPRSTQDHAYRLLALQWSGAPKEDLQAAAAAIVSQQRADGGWSQLPSLGSDAYATGQALVALAESGAVAVTDAAYARGVEFLLKTQFPDGSWYVRTRSLPIQPHFESGFPYGRDQFISAAATNWAARALTYIAPPKAGS